MVQIPISAQLGLYSTRRQPTVVATTREARLDLSILQEGSGVRYYHWSVGPYLPQTFRDCLWRPYGRD